MGVTACTATYTRPRGGLVGTRSNEMKGLSSNARANRIDLRKVHGLAGVRAGRDLEAVQRSNSPRAEDRREIGRHEEARNARTGGQKEAIDATQVAGVCHNASSPPYGVGLGPARRFQVAPPSADAYVRIRFRGSRGTEGRSSLDEGRRKKAKKKKTNQQKTKTKKKKTPKNKIKKKKKKNTQK